MNTAALIALVIALLGKTSETIPAGKLAVITASVGSKTCQANDAKCVAKVVKDAQRAVKAHSKALKAQSKEEGDDLCLISKISNRQTHL
jgi:hypothetical protein